MRNKIQSDAVKSIVKNNYQGIIDVAPRVGKSKIVSSLIALVVTFFQSRPSHAFSPINPLKLSGSSIQINESSEFFDNMGNYGTPWFDIGVEFLEICCLALFTSDNHIFLCL